MATTTRYKIAEQVLRIVGGGNPSDDSGIDIRDILALVDQERDAIIKLLPPPVAILIIPLPAF